jgi:ribosomal protein S14
MLKNKINNIFKDNTKRGEFLKTEIKRNILKSIIQNLNIKPNIRALALKKNSKIKIKSFISKQNNNLCVKSGRFKGVLNLTQISRHEMKKLGLVGSLQNIKISS